MARTKQEVIKANRPKRGDRTKVEPIKNLKDIRTLKRLLADRPMDLAYFTIGINTALRASDILSLKADQVRGLGAGDEIEVREKKTGKARRLTLNAAVIDAIGALLAAVAYEPGDYLFKSQRANGDGVRVWSVPYVSQKVKGWCRELHLKGNFGSHTLRKTWGYHQRVTFGQPLPVLTECLNHASQRQTLEYLCIQADEVKDVYMNEL